MAELKTRKTDADVDAFLAEIENEGKRDDAREIRRLMGEATGEPGSMWGTSIVGFGERISRYADGREAAWFAVGFSPRKRDLTLYIMDGFSHHESVLARLGTHRTGKACLYIKRLSDIDVVVLRELIGASVGNTLASANPEPAGAEAGAS
jgi:hypothetical protein